MFKKTGLMVLSVLFLTLLSFQFASADPTTIEEKMAYLDGYYPNTTKITRYQYLLTILEKKTGDSRESIGNMTGKAQEILKKQYGKEITMLDLLEEVNKSIPSRSKVPFSHVIAAYVMFLGQ
jgi:hypothetical protein